jgi:diguanylate cyclase (GGDEF)-like protein
MAKACVRDADILARYGGEEFTVILPETDFAGAAAVAERLRTNIEMLDICVSGVSIKVTVSVGYTSYRYGVMVKGKEAIIGLADKALYIAKQNGRNKVHALRFGAA